MDVLPGLRAVLLKLSYLRELCREMPQRLGFFDDAQPAQLIAAREDLDDRFDDVIDVALRIDAARNRQPNQLHRRMRRFARVGIDAAEHHAADFDGPNAGMAIKG